MTPAMIARHRRRNRAHMLAAVGVAAFLALTIVGAPIAVVILLVELPRYARATRYLDAEQARLEHRLVDRDRAARIRAFRSLP